MINNVQLIDDHILAFDVSHKGSQRNVKYDMNTGITTLSNPDEVGSWNDIICSEIKFPVDNRGLSVIRVKTKDNSSLTIHLDDQNNIEWIHYMKPNYYGGTDESPVFIPGCMISVKNDGEVVYNGTRPKVGSLNEFIERFGDVPTEMSITSHVKWNQGSLNI